MAMPGDLPKAAFRLPLQQTEPSLVAFLEFWICALIKHSGVMFKSEQWSAPSNPENVPLCRHGL